MNENHPFPQRKPTHMKCFDYSENHRYFITICSDHRRRSFSGIVVGEGLAPPATHLSVIGNIIEEQIRLLTERYPSLIIEKYVIMPNHVHILLLLENTGGASPSPTTHDIVCTLKSLVTRECRQKGIKETIWQRSYYEHIIRDEEDYKNAWLYIENNPAKWAEDKYYC